MSPMGKESDPMKVLTHAFAGTLESSDVFVEVRPSAETHIEVESVVAAQFGQAIEQSVLEVMEQLGSGPAHITLKDRGALDCTLRARVETALRRAMKEAAHA